jgi:hypothetical protein
VDKTVEDYTKLVQAAAQGNLQLANTDFDTGHDTRAGEYRLTDSTYAKLLDESTTRNFDQMSPALRENILAFYSDPNAPVATKKKPKAWKKTEEELERLRGLATPPVAK